MVFHLLTSLLIYLTISSLAGNSRIAFFAALLFTVHPVHTDSVTYISGRRDILSSLFYILGFYIFLKSRKEKRPSLLALSFASYLFAIASKEMAVTLPLAFLGYDLITNLPGQGKLIEQLTASLKKTFSCHKAFYLTFSLAAIAFTYYKVVVKSPSNKEGFYGDSFFLQSLTVCKILVYYLKQFLFPINLIADYSFNAFPLSQSLWEPATLFSLMILGTIAVFIVYALSRNKIAAFSLIWFFVTLLPVCHIFPHHELLAEHYLYLPSFGIVLLISLFLDLRITSPRWKYSVYSFLVLVTILFSVRTFYRNYDWENSYTLWKKTVTSAPSCVRALNNLGVEYYKRKDYRQAEALFMKAISIQPVYEKSYYNLGNLYKDEQRFAEALEMYKRATRLNPKSFRAHNNLGNAYAMQKLYDQAAEEYKRALKFKPRYAEAHNNLGNVYRSVGKIDLAITHYQKALELNPRYVDAYRNLANTYADLKQYDNAIQTLEKAYSKIFVFPSVVFNLASMYINAGRYDKAIELYKFAIEKNFNVTEAHTSLATLYTKMTRYEQAALHYHKAITLNPALAEAYLNLGNLYLEHLNDRQKGLAYLKKWLSMAPQNPLSERVRQKINGIEKGSRE